MAQTNIWKYFFSKSGLKFILHTGWLSLRFVQIVITLRVIKQIGSLSPKPSQVQQGLTQDRKDAGDIKVEKLNILKLIANY